MRRALSLGFALAALVLTVTGCGSSSSTPTATSGSSVALSTRTIKGLGTVVVNSQGRTLYTFARDKAQKVTCTGNCAIVWPALKIGSGQKPSVSGGVKASLLSSDPDPSGGQVVTYNHWPLYLYQADPMAGTDHGQAIDSNGGFWYAITPSGTLLKTQVKNTNGAHGYCLSVTARIATPDGPVQVDQLRPGAVVWSTDRGGHRIQVNVLKVHHTHVPADHMMVRLRLADGRRLLVSPGHPLPDGKPVSSLKAGQWFEGSWVVSAARVRYGRPYTYDLLPAGPTHTYFADGVLLGSTLVPGAG